MTPARKTTSIIAAAGLVVAAVAFLSAAKPTDTTAAPPPTTTTDDSGLGLSATLQSSHLLQGTADAYIAVTVRAPHFDGAVTRPPVHVAVVIDRSGSMSGEKLSHAKQSASHLVSQLRDGDRFSIVAYGSDVEVVFPSTAASDRAKDAAITAINAIYDDGGTNLSGGLIAGRGQLLSHPVMGSVSRIVLISDGLANEGVVDRDELAQLARETAQRGISVTTVGVGLDFDEQTMTKLAVSGRGNYYFVESSSMLASMFTKELEKLGTTTATEVSMSLQPKNGVEVIEALGYPMHREGNRVIVPIADLHAGELRKVVLRLRVNASTVGNLELAQVGVSFRPTKETTHKRVSTVVVAQITNDPQKVADSQNLQATRHIETARTAKAIDDATTLYEQGNTAGASQMLEKRMQEAEEVAADDADLTLQLRTATKTATSNFQSAAAAPRSKAGKRARKGNRNASFLLSR